MLSRCGQFLMFAYDYYEIQNNQIIWQKEQCGRHFEINSWWG